MQKLSESKKIWESYGMPKSSTPAFQCIFEELGDGFSIKKEEYGVRIDYPKIVTFLISHPDIEGFMRIEALLFDENGKIYRMPHDHIPVLNEAPDGVKKMTKIFLNSFKK